MGCRIRCSSGKPRSHPRKASAIPIGRKAARPTGPQSQMEDQRVTKPNKDHRLTALRADLWSVVALAFAPAALPAPAAATESLAPIALQPHRAIYDLSLDRTSAGTSVASVTGRVVYELMGSACEGYAQNMRFVTETTTTEGQAQISDLRTSSWEDAPAKRMRFNSSTYGNDQLVDQTQGTAAKGSRKPGVVAIDLSKPSRKTASISDTLLFPIEHSMAVIRHAKAGEFQFGANLYDGSEGGEKYYYTSSVIGRASTGGGGGLTRLAHAGKLSGKTSWPVSIAYFKPETDKVDGVPLYEMRFRFFENGITADLSIDHGEYSLKGEMTDLVMLDANPCPKGGN